MSSGQAERWVVFGYGNPSRGDDALGPALLRHAQQLAPPLGVRITWVEDFQLNIEHALDLKDMQRAVFFDAGSATSAPYQWLHLAPEPGLAHTSHALSPSGVLSVAQRLGQTLPDAYLLAVAGHDFALGSTLSPYAQNHLALASRWLCALWQNPQREFWIQRAREPLHA